MADSKKHTVLLISSTFKGTATMQQMKAMDCYVLLITEEKWRDEPWPYESIDEIFFTPSLTHYQDVIKT